MILLDSSVLIDIDSLELPADDYVSSAVVRAELELGVAMAKTAASHAQRQARLTRLIRSGLQWLPYTDSTATFHAQLMHLVHAEAPGKARSRDLMIAATAYEFGATLATLNAADFRRVEAKVPILVPSRREVAAVG